MGLGLMWLKLLYVSTWNDYRLFSYGHENDIDNSPILVSEMFTTGCGQTNDENTKGTRTCTEFAEIEDFEGIVWAAEYQELMMSIIKTASKSLNVAVN